MKIVRLRSGEEARLRAIRLRALHDAPEAFETTAAEAAARPSESWVTQLATLPSFVAVRDSEDLGLARFAPDEASGEMGWLISVWVSSKARHARVGSALIEAVVEFAKSEGVTQLALDVGDENAAAIALYESKGFEATGETSVLPPPRQHIREHRRVLRLTQ